MPTSPNTGAVVSVTVTTAVEMDDSLRTKVREKVAELYGADVQIVERVDPKIIGGIVIDGAGDRYDASVRTQLAVVRHSLSSAFVGGAK